MLGGVLHLGSGCGDQLFRIITSRTIAEEKGYEWGMVNPSAFKAASFMQLNIPEFKGVNPKKWDEKEIRIDGADVRSFDPESQFLEDNTIIDGSFEDERYWLHNIKNIRDWLKVEPLEVSDTKCIIGFRGGEYASVPELFLPEEYYKTGMRTIQHKSGTLNFEVHTDDPKLASQIFTRDDVKIVENQQISHSLHSNMGFNWRSARFAKYALIPNSAFFILPRLLKHHEDPTAVTIAPRYHAGRNVKQWRRPACYYRSFLYL